jgi:hypothetical protein
MRQKAYIKVLANIAKKTEDMHGELERDMEHQQEKILLHIKIESTRSKYLPDNASRKMRRQWFCRRIYLKLRWFHEYGPMNKIIQVMERTMAIATLLSGWSMLLKHTLRGELPHGWPFVSIIFLKLNSRSMEAHTDEVSERPARWQTEEEKTCTSEAPESQIIDISRWSFASWFTYRRAGLLWQLCGWFARKGPRVFIRMQI